MRAREEVWAEAAEGPEPAEWDDAGGGMDGPREGSSSGGGGVFEKKRSGHEMMATSLDSTPGFCVAASIAFAFA